MDEVQVVELGGHLRAQAEELFADSISLVQQGAISAAEITDAWRVRNWMASIGDQCPADTWVGVVEGRSVVAAAHAGPHHGQIVQLLDQLGRGVDPQWVNGYVKFNASIEEVAVVPGRRGQGIGKALMMAVEAQLRARKVLCVSGFACDAQSAEFFAGVGYRVGAPREPVPPAFAGGMTTHWWDAAPDEGRYFWRRLPVPGSSFLKAAHVP